MAECVCSDLERTFQCQIVLPEILERFHELFRLASDSDELPLVVERPVIGDPEEPVLVALLADLDDEDLDLERFRLAGEDHAERLGECGGQAHGGHVFSRVQVSHQVGLPDARLPQGLEFVVPAHTGEGDPVVDLTDLVQGGRRVLGEKQDPAAHSRRR